MQISQTKDTAQVGQTRRATKQPLDAVQLPDALLTLKVSSAATGLSYSTLYRKEAAGELKMLRLSARCTRIHSAELRRFIAEAANVAVEVGNA